MIRPRKVDKPLILYGYGKLGHLAQEIFNKLKIPIAGIYSVNNRTPMDLFNDKDALIAICIASLPYKAIIKDRCFDGWKDICSVYDIFAAYPECGITSGWFIGERMPKDDDGELAVSRRLEDILSRRHYNSFIAWHEDRTEINVPVNPADRFAIQSVLHDHENIFTESPGSTLTDIEERRHVVTLIDDYTQRYTYVQLHCEGLELESIEKSMYYLQGNRPIVAVTVYHTRDGLYLIEKTLMDALENYRWYFRCHAFQGQGAILYGIPNERKVR